MYLNSLEVEGYILVCNIKHVWVYISDALKWTLHSSHSSEFTLLYTYSALAWNCASNYCFIWMSKTSMTTCVRSSIAVVCAVMKVQLMIQIVLLISLVTWHTHGRLRTHMAAVAVVLIPMNVTVMICIWLVLMHLPSRQMYPYVQLLIIVSIMHIHMNMKYLISRQVHTLDISCIRQIDA